MTANLLRAVDGLNLPEEYRALLRPGEAESDSHGRIHHLPRFFYEIHSWQKATMIRWSILPRSSLETRVLFSTLRSALKLTTMLGGPLTGDAAESDAGHVPSMRKLSIA
jgi:hypothetical protein